MLQPALTLASGFVLRVDRIRHLFAAGTISNWNSQASGTDGAGLRPSAVFTQRRTRLGLRGARPGPATKVCATKRTCRSLPGPAAGHRHHCRSTSDLGGPTRLNHLETMLCLRPEGGRCSRYPMARQFIEQNKRSSNVVNFNDSATVEPAQRGSVFDCPCIRNPRRQDCPLFRGGQLRIARDVTGVRVDRRPVS